MAKEHDAMAKEHEAMAKEHGAMASNASSLEVQVCAPQTYDHLYPFLPALFGHSRSILIDVGRSAPVYRPCSPRWLQRSWTHTAPGRHKVCKRAGGRSGGRAGGRADRSRRLCALDALVGPAPAHLPACAHMGAYIRMYKHACTGSMDSPLMTATSGHCSCG